MQLFDILKGSSIPWFGGVVRIIVTLGGVILVAVVLMLTHDGIRFYLLVQKSGLLIKKTIPFSRSEPHAAFKILILGDSTAFGTGAADPENSTAGRLAARYPKASVTNLAVNGLRIAGLLSILETIDKKTLYDIILIQIGANDIIRLTPIHDIESGINRVLTRAELFGGQVIVLHSGNVGDAPLFPWYVRSWFNRRSLAVRDIYLKAAPAHGAEYVDLINSPANTMMRQNVQEYYADDFLHLTDAGYGLWFDEIQKHLK